MPQVVAKYLDGTLAPRVTVSLEIIEFDESFFKQNIVSDMKGVVTFTVPGLPTSAKTINIKVTMLRSIFCSKIEMCHNK